MRCAFTLIELLVVVLIMAILGGLIILGLGDTTAWAQVQRSSYALVQTIQEGQFEATSTGFVQTMAFNNASPKVRHTISGNTTSRPNYNDISIDGVTYTNGLEHRWNAGNRSFALSPAWSDASSDQWYALLGPWRDHRGLWHRPRGGPPLLDSTDRELGVYVGSDNTTLYSGGIWGLPPSPTTGVIGGAQRETKKAHDDGVWAMKPDASWVWDPNGCQRGPRRYLDPGTRWMICKDAPEWGFWHRNGGNFAVLQTNWGNNRNHGRVQIMWDRAVPAHVRTGQPVDTNEGARTWNFDLYPSGRIGRNGLQRGDYPEATTYTSVPGNPYQFDQQARGYVGIVSRKARTDTFTHPTDPVLTFDYERPVAMQWVTLFENGNVSIGTAPRVSP